MNSILSSIVYDFRVTGRESRDGALLTALSSAVDEVKRDRAGNFVGLVRGAGGDKKKIMLQTHMDGAGFVATGIEENGLVRFGPTGNFSLKSAAYTEATTENGVRGIITPDGGSSANLTDDCLSYALDVGAADKESAERLVKAGDFISPVPHMTELGDGEKNSRLFCGYPLDGRAGAAVLIKCAEALMKNRPENDVYIVLSVEGHNNYRMAGTAAANIRPDEALAIDYNEEAKPGDGVSVVVQRKYFVADQVLTEELRNLAEKEEIKHNISVSASGDAPGRLIQAEGEGTPTAELDLPVSRRRTVSETIAESDMLAAARLAELFCRRL